MEHIPQEHHLVYSEVQRDLDDLCQFHLNFHRCGNPEMVEDFS